MMICSYLVLVLTASLQCSVAYKKFWAWDGCWEKPGNFHNGTTRGVALDTGTGLAAVRCCSTDGSSCITPAACPSGKTHKEATDICAARGKRLCSLPELQSGICCETGCDFDYMTNVWTKDEVTIRGVLADMCDTMMGFSFPKQPFMPNITGEPDTSLAYALCVKKPSATTFSFPYTPKPVPYYVAEKMCKDLPPHEGEAFDVVDSESIMKYGGTESDKTVAAMNACLKIPVPNARIWVKDDLLFTAYTAMDGCKIRNYGSLARSSGGKDYYYNTFEKHAVRCCSYDGAYCTTATRWGCESAVTWYEAHEACNEMGMRLCKKEELDDDKCCVTGCMFDVDKVWTGTPTFVGRAVKKNQTGDSCNYFEDLEKTTPGDYGVVCCGENSVCEDPVKDTCTKKKVEDAFHLCKSRGLEVCRDSRLCSRCKHTKCYQDGVKLVAFKTYVS